jgi:peptidoglycan biosynthesis protein MviN/MurJ (putative lipid II flippase)
VRAALAVCLPYSFLLCLFPVFFVKLILGYGHFGVVDTALTAQALRYYALALPALYMNGIFSRIMIIKEYFRGMFALLGVNIALNIVMNYIFLFNLHMGLRGLVIATVIVAYVDLGLRMWMVKGSRSMKSKSIISTSGGIMEKV